MDEIKFGTDGWRAIIAKEYTVDNVMRVAEGTAKWLKKQGGKQVVIGYDCRFGGEMFCEVTAQVLGAYGIKSLLAKDFISTPMVSLGVVKTNSDIGIVITASHNPPSYNGFKLKSGLGGPMFPSDIAAVENEVPDSCSVELPSMKQLEESGLVEYYDFEGMYLDHVAANFDLDAIHKSGLKIAYDGMYGAGQSAMRKLFPNAFLIHCDFNPSFKGQAPEPIEKNLKVLAQIIKSSPDISLGIANDGDADRIGMFDSEGNFVDSHHLLLLLLLYQFKYRGLTGKVVITFSVTDKMTKMAQLFGLDLEVTKIGFKYIAEIMANDDVLVGGEESGGLAVKGHIPERDGIWIGLMILEFMAKSGKTLRELIQEIYDLVGSFAFERDDYHLDEATKEAVIDQCKNAPYSAFGEYPVKSVQTTDGFKFILGDGKWLLIRPSGTEPVLRVYSEAPTNEEARNILNAARATVLGGYSISVH